MAVVPRSRAAPLLLAGTAFGLGGLYEWIFGCSTVDYEVVRKDITAALDSNPKYDDGSYGPVLVRLAWHAAGTYDVSNKSGGSDGATMRFSPEADHGANAGLDLARALLNPIQAKYPKLSHADLWILAGCVAIEHMGGPKVDFHPGRTDKPNGTFCPPDGRLPDASQGAAHVRAVFNRQGFNDQEMVALIGAHCLGRCHTTRSGFDGPWTNSPTTFSNDFFIQLTQRKWTKRKWSGPAQYADESGTLMMLPADIALLEDAEFKKWVNIYAQDEERFFKDFSKAFQKLLENGCGNLSTCPVAHK
jgi:catalase (peroxidase I)